MPGTKIDELMRRLLSGGLSALIIKVASAGLSYVMLVVLARLMPAPEYGRFAFGFSLAITISLLLSFGLPVAVLRFWPEYRVKGDMEMARSFVARAFSFVFVGAALAAVVFVAASLAVTGASEGYGMSYLAAIAVLMVLMAVSEFVASALRADGSIILALGPRDVLWRIVLIGVCIAVARQMTGFGAETALQLAGVCLLMVIVPQLIHAVRRLRIARSDLAGRTQTAQWARAAWPMWGSAILFGLVQQFDTVLLGLFLSPEQTGPYFAALRTASLMSLLLIAGNMVAAPLISQFYHDDDDAGLHRMCRLLIVGIALPTLAGFTLLVMLGPWLLSLFDETFTSAYPMLVVLGLGFTLTALAGPVAYFLQMVGREKEYLAIVVLVYAGVIATQCIAIPVYGPMGAAVPNAAGAGIAAFWAVILLRKRVGFDPSIIGLAWPARGRGAAV